MVDYAVKSQRYYHVEIRNVDDNVSWGRHLRFIELARAVAFEGEDFQHRHGALIVSGSRILGRGRNNYRTGAHAETAAIGRKVKGEYAGAVMYVARARREQEYGLSAPCSRCFERAKLAGIKGIYYSTNDPEAPIAYLEVI